MFHSKVEIPSREIPEHWDPRAKKIIAILDGCLEERAAARVAMAGKSQSAQPPEFVPFWRWKLEQSWRTYAKVAALVLGTAGLIGAGYLENTRRIEAAADAVARLEEDSSKG